MAFNAAHPPFATSVDELPPPTTDSAVIGTSVVAKDNFDYVRDPAYLWQDMPTVTPAERERRAAVKAAKDNEVESYSLQRTTYWERVGRLQFAEDVEHEVQITVGLETIHQRTESETVTETIGLTLGLELSGNLFSPGKAKAVKEFRIASRQNLGKASGSAEFTYELSRELRFERVDATTYREEKTVTTRTIYLGGAVYYVWSLVEQLSLFRKRPGLEALEPVSVMVAGTPVSWTDRLMYREPSAEKGEVQ